MTRLDPPSPAQRRLLDWGKNRSAPSVGSSGGRRAAGSASGFSLIEVAAVMLIVGLLAGTAALSLRGVGLNVDLEGWVEQAATLDRRARERAQRDGVPRGVVVDLEAQTMWVERAGVMQRQDEEAASNKLLPPKGWRYVDAGHLDGDLASLSNETKNFRGRGQVSFTVASDGFGDSYAVELRDRADRLRGWLVAGGSGQTTMYDDERLWRETLQTLVAAGDDAD